MVTAMCGVQLKDRKRAEGKELKTEMHGDSNVWSTAQR